MINNRVAFMSALALGVLSIFLMGSSQAALMDTDSFEPSDVTRLNPSDGISFSVVLNADETTDEAIIDGTFVVVFGDPDGSWSDEVALVCDDTDVAVCDGTGDDLDGIWKTPDTLTAEDTVSAPGDEVIFYNFKISTSDGDFEWRVDPLGRNSTGITVNTLPVLTDNAAVAGDDMPYSERTISITYTDLDGHTGTVSAEVCDAGDNCQAPLIALTKESGDEETGAVYSATFTTAFGGALTATISGFDGFDSAEDERTAAFSVDTETPWLVSDSVSLTTATTSEVIVFDVVYCVWEAQSNPAVAVDVGGVSYDLDEGASADEDCTNGVGNAYSVSTTVAWAAAAQIVEFSGSNDAATGDDLVSASSVTINDLPTMSDNLVQRVGDDFVIQITATDANLDAGDSLTVNALVEHSSAPYAMSFEDPHYEVTIPEASIINERGGFRAVTFQVLDLHNEIVAGDFGDQIDVTLTSNFDMEIKGGGSTDITTAPGTSTYTYTITNNGNFEDNFTIATSSVNGWFSAVDYVIVAYGSTSDFDVTVTVPKVLAGTKDTWTVTSSASNDDTVADIIVSGSTTVDTVAGHELTGGSDLSGNPGDTVTYHFTILNTGNAQEKFFYTISSSWDLDNIGGDTTLEMGVSDTISVTQTIPVGAAADATSSVTFTVVGGASESVTTSANQIYELSVSADTLIGLKPGESGTLSFTITNEGNGFDTYAIGYNGIWATGVSSSTEPISSGSFATVTVTVAIPANAASGASSVVGLSASGSMDTGASDSYDVAVASSTRSLAITGADQYTFNEGTVGQGTATIQNNGVSTTFIVTSMSDSVSFATSSYVVGAGASEVITFDIMATASGDQTFTISDNVDFNPATHTFTLTARTFSTDMSAWGLAECSNSGVTCTYDMNSWDGSAYTNAGTWTTSMVFVDVNGQSGTHTFDTTIANSNPTVAAPSLSNPVQGTEQQFSFTIPTDADGSITHFVIEFGDGESQTFQASDFSGEVVTATHTYSKSGNFDVVATAYDNSGGSTMQTVAVSVSDEMVTLEGSSYTYNLIALLGFFLLGAILSGTAFKMQQGEIAGDEEMNERDRQRLESVERRMESISEREELMEVSAYDASRAATKLEEHIAAFNSILVKAQEIAAEDKLKELEAAEKAREKKDEEMQLDLEDPDIEMVAERFHDSLARLVAARDDLSKIEKHLARILKMERDEQLEKLTEMTESYETTKRKIDALESSKEARDAAAVENNIMNMLSAAASGGSMNDANFGDFGDFGGDDDEYEVEIYEDEDGSFYYIDPDTGEEVPCDEDGNAL
ncbi:MAG: hypothetical protein BEU00_02635 [Marine Group III euryarchaeote CG-Epi3]|uniref:PKD domain-containing protein n=1 Tax=Marine Group III euryarchaeote CG-Epi3 TaxID=1888997 RepID=A0A1J5TRC3_9ARCH|nr:MAG: hypothetical protein BEU00_02635 [Marine Group III euryarchaeote CG-Epi3]